MLVASDLEDYLEPKDLKDLKVLLVMLEFKDLKDQLVLKVLKDLTDQLDLLVKHTPVLRHTPFLVPPRLLLVVSTQHLLLGQLPMEN